MIRYANLTNFASTNILAQGSPAVPRDTTNTSVEYACIFLTFVFSVVDIGKLKNMSINKLCGNT